MKNNNGVIIFVSISGIIYSIYLAEIGLNKSFNNASLDMKIFILPSIIFIISCLLIALTKTINKSNDKKL